jgi:hypothetical protein
MHPEKNFIKNSRRVNEQFYSQQEISACSFHFIEKESQSIVKIHKNNGKR